MIKKINYIFNRRQKIQLIIMAFMIMLGALLELLGVSSLLPVANVMMDASLLETNEKYHRISELIGVTEVTEFIVMMCAAIIMVYIFKNVYLLFLYYVQIRFAQNNRIRLSSALIDYYLHREYSYHTEHNISEMRRNIISDAESFYTLVEVVIQFFIEIVTCGIILVYIFFTDYRTAFMMLVLIGLPVCSFIIYFRKKLYKQGEKLRSYSVITTKWFLQALGGVKEVKAINKEHFFTEKYTDACWKEISMARRSSLIQKIPRYLVEICCISGMMIIIIARMIHGADLQEFAGTLVVIAVAAARLMPSFNRITEYVGVIMYRKPSLDAIYNDVCMLRKKRLEKDKETGQRLHLINEILVKDLTFKYPNTEKNVFANINLIIKKNTSIALIGPSGAGKTTFADVIMGLYSPDYGQIYVDNIDVFDNIEKWRNSIGYIPQVIYLTDDTIRNNIAFGENEKDIEDEKIWKALKEASLEEFVKGLENGLDTMVGDRGIRLSGGQRQRIGIARALYRDPEILILDEATSALDQDTENAIMESMENLHGNVTMLIIAHRLSTIKNCDVIYEIKDGNLTPKTREQVFDVKRNDLGGTECTNGE